MNFAPTEIDEVLTNNIKQSFVNDYRFWKNIINSTNNAIDNDILELDDEHLYTYDEFCKKFIINIEEMRDGTIFTQDTVQDILLKMIHEKI